MWGRRRTRPTYKWYQHVSFPPTMPMTIFAPVEVRRLVRLYWPNHRLVYVDSRYRRFLFTKAEEQTIKDRYTTMIINHARAMGPRTL